MNLNIDRLLQNNATKQLGVLNFVVDLINSTQKQLEHQLAKDSINIQKILLPNLINSYYETIWKLLTQQYLVLNKDQNISFEIYCNDLLRQSEVKKYLLHRFPILESRLLSISETWVQQSFDILTQLEKNAEEIKRVFDIDGSLYDIKYIQFGLGDKHRGGKSVALIEFLSNEKLIFKPRGLDIDKNFNAFLTIIDKQLNIGFKSPKLLSKKHYGFVEYIEHQKCSTQKELQHYYDRLGGLLAILYLLEATDFHYENIIAQGAYPILIDLESFFHPHIPIQGTETNQGLDRSVLRTGLLPNSFSLDNAELDISGISDVANRESLIAQQRLQLNKDGYFDVIREKGKLVGGKNVPYTEAYEKHIPKIQSDWITKGFEKVYSFILENRPYLKAQLELFKNCEIRILFRNTIVYTHLLDESRNSNVMLSQQALYKHFEILKKTIPDYKVSELFVEYEIEDLEKGDVPMFTTKTDSTHLWYADEKYLKNFFNESGYDTVLKKLDAFSESDLNQQLWIINTSLELANQNKEHNNNSLSKLRIDSKSRSTTTLKQEASKAITFIKDNINCSDEFANWLVLKTESLDGQKFRMANASYDFFSGLPGEILFLAHAESIDKDAKEIAGKAYNQLVKHISISKDSIRPIGLYAGWGSVIYLNALLWNLTKEEKYKKNTRKIFEQVDFQHLIQIDKNFSLIKGSAGFIVACLKYYDLTSDTQSLFLAEEAAQHLINCQTKTEIGTGWRIASKVPLSGLAHGSSGFALAFALLYNATKNEKYKEVVYQCLDYENSLFSPKDNNWIDKRNFITTEYPNQDYCSTAWSHGAGGIGLTRLKLIKLGFEDAFIKKDLEIAVQTVLNNNFGGLHTLTYGDFGNLELLYQYATTFNDDNVYQQWNKITTALLNDINHNGWKLGLKKVNSLGLMAGVTGIGYQCLRFLYPDQVPSILMPE